ncbi:hypothetical protein A2773_07110 [Candidatus Gottesmanbacteria bacterium RIFCSPHIGHO2_01_FULL_39_10]|uniref:Glycosyltransferase 2-like domain-containing protein n=1 Tax=Candidatus Gottesmanbacteria bacterium RIFCSPHIGHO2_01_FULL_39_10 TaxID=1798375 RepID=A0A1F5ZQR0_9BACT|nr:MAG: hypothetical protein A2773_07110 [Candidatus Gottesmanbacteria bacterium RIFCSPHIGHO2_01_FULL_39_10]
MKTPYFSIVIPTLNEEKCIQKILADLQKQTYKDFEVIVVDGLSDDRTLVAAKKFEDRLPKLATIKGGKNNVSYQRNLGAKKASGKYLIFFDADVRFDRTFLEEIHIATLKKKFKLGTTWFYPDSDDSMDSIVMMAGNIGLELAKAVNKPYAAGGANIIMDRKTFESLGGFREDLKLSEDHDLVERARKKNIDITILKEPRAIVSLRRFRAEGTLSVLRKYAQVYIYGILKGPITREIFDYPMGGHIHIKKRRKLDLTKLDTYIKGIEKLEKKINRLLEA